MNFTPIIEAITKLVGHTDPVAIERAIGGLSKPETQAPLIHDFLRGAQALKTMDVAGAPVHEGISRPTWESYQAAHQSQVDTDPEVQSALRNIALTKANPPDPTIKQKVLPTPVEATSQVREVPDSTEPGQKLPGDRKLKAESDRAKQRAFEEFQIATDENDPVRTQAAVEQIKALHSDEAPQPGQVPHWEAALNYIDRLEKALPEFDAQGLKGDDWSKAIEDFQANSNLAPDMPNYLKKVVIRANAWADAQKPPDAIDRLKDVWHASRAIQSSMDLSAPGRQGIALLTRPEYRESLPLMTKALDTGEYNRMRAELRNHPLAPIADQAGLELTEIGSKLKPAEEAFRSKLAEKIPGVRQSEQAYLTFLNQLRFKTFANEIRSARGLGVDVEDPKYLNDLAEWINTATGRGGGKKFNPGPLGEIFYSPRLMMSRMQLMNPLWYAQMHPAVRAAAIKAHLGAAITVYGLISLAALGGAKVTWDFRNTDAGYVRVGNMRYDLSGGMFPWMRLVARMVSGKQVNPEGKVTDLTTGKPYSASRADLALRFLRSKEAPMVSLVHDMLAGKDVLGQKFDVKQALASRYVPLFVQDVYSAFKDKGLEGALMAIPSVAGISFQDYQPNQSPEKVPFHGVNGVVPPEMEKSFSEAMAQADAKAAEDAARIGLGKNSLQKKAITRKFVAGYRAKARQAWIMANKDAYVQALQQGVPQIPLQTPREALR